MAKWYAQYWIEDGQLQAEGCFDPDEAVTTQDEEGNDVVTHPHHDDRLEVKEYPEEVDTQVMIWDPVTLDYVPRSMVEVQTSTTRISKRDFLIQRLTLPVLGAALTRESSDPQIAAFRMAIDNTEGGINLDDMATIMGVHYLESLGLITAADVDRILAPELINGQ